jgi:hypothetical protein
LSVRTGGASGSYSLSGSITTAQTPGTPDLGRMNAVMTGDLLIASTSPNRQARINDISLTRTYQPSLRSGESEWQLTGTARVYDSVAGYVDVSIESGLLTRDIDSSAVPPHGGSLVLSGAGGARFWLTALTRDLAAVELDANTDGTPDRTLSFRWADEFSKPASNRSGPVAISGPDLLLNAASSPGPFHLEGRFSESSTGTFLSHRWSVVFAPPGSTASLVAADTARATFTPDRNGSYLFRLQVSDGVGSSIDYFILRATGYAGLEESISNGPVANHDRRSARVVLEPDIVAAAGTSLLLEGSRSYAPDGTPMQNPVWNAYDHIDSSSPPTTLTRQFGAALVSSGVTQRASFSTERAQAGDFPSSSQFVVLPPNNPRMAPTVELPSLVAQSADNSTVAGVADFNGDGIEDVVLARPDFSAGVRLLRVMLGGRDGRLQQFGNELTVQGAFSFNEAPAAIIGDVDGDARPDLVVADPAGLGYFTQTGTVAAPFVYRTALSGCDAAGNIRLADADGDGDLDVFARADCYTSRLALFRNDGGTFAAAVPLNLTGAQWAFGTFVPLDLNADGRADLVAVDIFNTVSTWLATNTPSTYSPGPMVSTFANFAQTWPVVADLDGNGRPDLLASAAEVQLLMQATDGTLTFRTVGTGGGHPGTGTVVAVRDFDGDGLKDILGTSGWYKQAAGANFGPWQPYARGIARNIGDINGDGRPDLLNDSFITLQASPALP